MSFILLLAAAAGASVIDAESPTTEQDRLMRRFSVIDRDRNGYVTANEAPRVVRTRCDCTTAPAPGVARAGWIQEFDQNGDAKVTAAEFAAGSASAAGIGVVTNSPLRRDDPQAR